MSKPVGKTCPAKEAHGPVIPWPRSAKWGWHCPHREHDGTNAVPQTRAFFTTAEVDKGALDG